MLNCWKLFYIKTHFFGRVPKLEWEFEYAGSVDTSIVKFPEVIWNMGGYKKIKLNVIESGLIVDEQIDSILVFDIPTPSFTIDTQKLCDFDTVLITYTGTGTSNAIYNWNFNDGNIISGTGQGDFEINWKNSGLKEISLSVEENGCFSQVSTTTLSVYQPSSSFTLDNVVCENQNTKIEFNGIATDSATLNWDFDAANIVSETNETYIVNWDNLGDKTVSLIINDNGCLSSQKMKNIEHNPVPNPTFTVPDKVCYNGIANIEYVGNTSNLAQYKWSFDNGSVLSGIGEGPYEIIWSNSGLKTVSLIVTDNGCSSDTSINLTVNQQTIPISICMVSVATSNNNMIVWEQALDNPYDSIIIYKETSHTDVYEKIGSQSANNTTVFTDLNSNPAQNSSRYKIALIDTCGFETEMSDFHKTMHLTINSGQNGAWNLIWDDYEGFEYSTFIIYRGLSKDNMMKIAEQSSNSFTYTDLYPPADNNYYQIEIENPNPCFIESKKSFNSDYLITRSIIVNPNGTDIDKNINSSMKIWPNPTKGNLYIDNNQNRIMSIRLLSINGRVIQEFVSSQTIINIDIPNKQGDLFFLGLKTGNEFEYRKIIKNN